MATEKKERFLVRVAGVIDKGCALSPLLAIVAVLLLGASMAFC
ncbi:MAG TPA: hypothetical protein VMM12_05440 [Longimicrobiales bacterium]|nr:hypothetical protein [Longimicrobiales bacterium]